MSRRNPLTPEPRTFPWKRAREGGVRSARTGSVMVALLVVAACSSVRGDRERPSVAPPESSPSPNGGPIDEVTVDGMLMHLEALQAIADAHDGTRVAGSSGFDASTRYVADVLRATGYEVTFPSTEVPFFEQHGPSSFELIEPERRRWIDGRDFRATLFSASGDVRAAIDRVQGGCRGGDFAGFRVGAVAVIEPSHACFRRLQVVNAERAGAVAVIAVSTAARGSPLRPTLVSPAGIDVPVLSVTAETGEQLVEHSIVRIRTDVSTSFRAVRSVVAELPGSGGGNVVMLGGHLDSVMDGPGINDDGSGVAMLLETARWAAGLKPAPSVRFAFWAGEEEGLYGSWAYAHELRPDELERIAVYLNLDMVGSSNFITFVYEPSPTHSEISHRVAELFASALHDLGAESQPLDLQGASDHAAFEDVGVPTGGLYSGSQEVKEPAQAEDIWEIAGGKLDPCYHQPCDTIDNVSDRALELHSLALVHVLTVLFAA
jgi:Zn-dependent M28 family amino/carboxypeptidase